MQPLLLSVSAVFLAGLGLTSTSVAAPLVDLGTLGGPESVGVAVNNSGQVAGTADAPDLKNRAFLYSGGVMTNLGLLPGGTNTFAVDINASGQVIGAGDVTGGFLHGFLYSGGTLTDIGTLGGTGTGVTDINDAGQVVGSSTTASGHEHAFLYSDGVMTDLGTLGGTYSAAVAVNSSGEIAGSSSTADGRIHAFRYSGGVMTDLGALGAKWAFATDINDAGQIVGWLRFDPSGVEVFVVNGNSMSIIEGFGLPVGWFFTDPVLISDSGDIVGRSLSKGSLLYRDGFITELYLTGHRAINGASQVVGGNPTGVGARVYSEGIGTSLGGFGGAAGHALAVSETGWIVGTSALPNGDQHAFLRAPECGDGIVDPNEECDDWNVQDGDCCASDCAYPGPITTCIDAAESSLDIKNKNVDGKDSLKWRWTGEGIVTQPDLGDPASTTTYTICVSDSTAGSDRLVASMKLESGANWTDRSPRGWQYEDDSPYSDTGVERARISLSPSGKTRLRLNARTAALPLPNPHSTSEFFDQDGRVTVQLFNDATSTCWNSEFDTARINTAGRFKAQAP